MNEKSLDLESYVDLISTLRFSHITLFSQQAVGQIPSKVNGELCHSS